MQPRRFSRRAFLEQGIHAGLVGSVLAASAGALLLAPDSAHAAAHAAVLAAALPESGASGEWDTRWIERIRAARHRAVFDMPGGDGGLDLAARFLENVDDVFGVHPGQACAVLNIRTRAVTIGLDDALWSRYPLGEDAGVTDPATGKPALRNVNRALPADALSAQAARTLTGLQAHGAIILVCDFALGHLARRLATKSGRDATAVLVELRAGLLPGAVAVPSGIFGLAIAQNAGCAFVAA
jgi:hypothetical protein